MARRTIVMRVTVTVPDHMSAAEARREVRTLVNEQCNYAAEEGDVKVRGIVGVSATKPKRRKSREHTPAWARLW